MLKDKDGYTAEELGKMAREINANAKETYTRPVVVNQYTQGEWETMKASQMGVPCIVFVNNDLYSNAMEIMQKPTQD